MIRESGIRRATPQGSAVDLHKAASSAQFDCGTGLGCCYVAICVPGELARVHAAVVAEHARMQELKILLRQYLSLGGSKKATSGSSLATKILISLHGLLQFRVRECRNTNRQKKAKYPHLMCIGIHSASLFLTRGSSSLAPSWPL